MEEKLQYPILIEIGLNQTEAQIYETLLKNGPQTGSKIAELSGIGRGNVYNAMEKLLTEHLVIEKQGKVSVFEAAAPSALENLLNRQKNHYEQLRLSFGIILPMLSGEYRFATGKPIVRVFEGIDGLKQMYLETLDETDIIYALVSPDEPHPDLFAWLTKTYVNKRVKAGVKVKVVVNGESEKSTEYIQKNISELREAKFVHNSLYPFKGEIDVFNDKIAFFAYKENELMGMIIENNAIAITLASTIKLLFDTLPN